MTGQMHVRRLTKSGNYKSALDFDPSFAGADYPKGLFKMVIQPIENSEGQHEIRYMRTAFGLIVSGEGYIITGASEAEIDSKFRANYARDRWENLIQREVFSEQELW